MSEKLLYVIFFAFYSIMVVGSLLALSRTAAKVHGELDQLANRARAAMTRGELLQVRKDLAAYHQKNCCIRHFGDHAREVLAFIDGKLQSL